VYCLAVVRMCILFRAVSTPRCDAEPSGERCGCQVSQTLASWARRSQPIPAAIQGRLTRPATPAKTVG